MSVLPTNIATQRDTSRFVKSVSAGPEVLGEESFRRLIAMERKRTERTSDPFLLLLLEAGDDRGQGTMEESLTLIAASLSASLRETDIIGWHQERTTVGALFTGLQNKDKNLVASLILDKISAILRKAELLDQMSNLKISYYFFPDNWDRFESGRPIGPALYPDLLCPEKSRESALKIKRVMDVGKRVEFPSGLSHVPERRWVHDAGTGYGG
jgi:hypothetical protein